MRLLFPFVLVLLLMGGAWSYYNLYPPQANKKLIQASLDVFAQAVETHDRAKVSEALNILLTEDATIKLNVHMFSIRSGERPPYVQDFTKAQFIQFIDNTLYTLTDYAYTPLLISHDSTTHAVQFSSKEWADGANMLGGISVNMRYSSDTICDGVVVLEKNQAKLSQAVCNMQFRQVPKPGQTEKFQELNSLKELIIRN